MELSRSEELPQSQVQYLKTLLLRMEEVHPSQADPEKALWYLAYKKSVGCKSGLSHKLCPLFVDPFIVVLPNDLYCERQQKKATIHNDRLHKCEDQAIPFWVSRWRHLHGWVEQGVGDATITEGVNSDLDETVAFGEDVREASSTTGVSGEEVPAVNSEEDEPEWNFEKLFGSMEPDESQRGIVRRGPLI